MRLFKAMRIRRVRTGRLNGWKATAWCNAGGNWHAWSSMVYLTPEAVFDFLRRLHACGDRFLNRKTNRYE